MTAINKNKLYVSDWCKNTDRTPENNFDPRYYCLYSYDEYGNPIDKPIPEIMKYIVENFGEDSCLVCGARVYTDNYDVQKFLQDKGFEPMWFDVHENYGSVADILSKEGWEW